jgi:hypothetical protein
MVPRSAVVGNGGGRHDRRHDRATDVPIMTHSHAKSRRGLDQQRILREEGVDLSRVLIGHSNETGDVDDLVRGAGRLLAGAPFFAAGAFGPYGIGSRSALAHSRVSVATSSS